MGAGGEGVLLPGGLGFAGGLELWLGGLGLGFWFGGTPPAGGLAGGLPGGVDEFGELAGCAGACCRLRWRLLLLLEALGIAAWVLLHVASSSSSSSAMACRAVCMVLMAGCTWQWRLDSL